MREQLIGSLFALAVAGQLWGQGLYEKYERMLTLPEGYVCYRVDGKIKVDQKRKHGRNSLCDQGRNFCQYRGALVITSAFLHT